MNLLALDTSSLACSVAAQHGDEVVERHEEKAREHTRLLLPMIRGVLAEVGLAAGDLDAVVLGNGPGSFIGMRIAASVAQGLAFGAGLKIVPVSSMAAVAAQAFAETDATEVVVAQDAHMNEVYLGLYRAGKSRLPEEQCGEMLHDQGIVLALEKHACAARLAAGAGWSRYPALLAANRHLVTTVSAYLHPHARFLLGTASKAIEEGAVLDPQNVVPAYLRQNVAKKPAGST